MLQKFNNPIPTQWKRSLVWQSYYFERLIITMDKTATDLLTEKIVVYKTEVIATG